MRKYIVLLLAAFPFFALMAIACAEDRGEVAAQSAKAASKDGAEKKPYQLPEMQIIVSATKTTAPENLSPMETYTVDKDKIDAQPDYMRANYGQLLQDVPGVVVGQAPYKNPPWINLRGTGDFSARTLYLIDGVPVGSSISLANGISNNDIERIDVVMGPSSALYGSNASGGVVNIITRQGKKGMGATFSYGYGSNNTMRAYGSVGGAARKGDNLFHYYVSYSADYSDGFKTTPVDAALQIYSKASSFLTTATVDDADYQNNYFSAKTGWVGSKGESLQLSFNYANQNINGGQQNLIPVDNGVIGVGNMRFQLPVGNAYKLTFTAGYQYWDRPSKTNYGISLSGTTLKYDYRKRYSQESNVKRMPFEIQNDFNLGNNNILTAGIFLNKERITSETDDWTTMAFRTGSDYTQQQRAFYIQDQAFFLNRKLSVIAGMRYDYWKYYNIYDSSSTNQHPNGSNKNAVTFRSGLKYQFNDAFALKASGGTAYYPGLPTWYFQNVTTGTTWRQPNPDLKPEKTWMTDLGMEGKLKATGTNVSLTGYYGRIQDMFSGQYNPHPTLKGVSIITYSNVGKSKIYGLETLVDQRISDSWSTTLNLTLDHSVITEDPTNQGHRMANTPGVVGSLGLKYKNPKLLSGSVTMRTSSSQYYDNENTQLRFYHMDKYVTFDAKLWRDWNLSEKIVLKTSISMENLLDRNFYPESIYVNPGRTVMGNMSVNYKF